MRDDEWLNQRFEQIWQLFFPDVEKKKVFIRWKGQWKNKHSRQRYHQEKACPVEVVIETGGYFRDEIADRRHRVLCFLAVRKIPKQISTFWYTAIFVFSCPSQPKVAVKGSHHRSFFNKVLSRRFFPYFVLFISNRTGESIAS